MGRRRTRIHSVWVEVEGAERFRTHRVATREQLNKLLAFARIGSRDGAPRLVYVATPNGKRLIARYEGGKSATTEPMRKRRGSLFGIVLRALALEGLRRLVG